MKKKVLIIGYVWLEKTSGAGTRMLQLIESFISSGFDLYFGSAAQKTQRSLNLYELEVKEQQLMLNSECFDRYITKLRPDIVVFDRFMVEEQFGWRVAEFCPHAMRILDTEDLHFLRKTRGECKKVGKDCTIDDLLASKIAKRELASILRCDLSLIISSYEINLLTDVFKVDPSLLIHLPFLLDNISEQDILKLKNYEQRKDYVFVGNYLHAPNVDAVLKLKSLWKQIRMKNSKACLQVYGAYPSQQILELHKPNERFFVNGYVVGIKEVVGSARVVLAPLSFGAGIKGKLVEAMQCGTPSVTTEIGAEGMSSNRLWNGYISSIDNFCSDSVKLYNDKALWEASQKTGFQIVNSFYSKTNLSNKFNQVVLSIVNNLNKHRLKNVIGSILLMEMYQSKRFMSKWIFEKNKQ